MANFIVFFPTLLKHEGGFVDDPDDPGGATNKGVTMKTFERYAESLLNIQPTLENLKNLTDDQASEIYKAKYWDRIKGDAIKDQNLADIVFDFYVNAGANASKLLQSVMNDAGANVKVDGGIGTKTISALDDLDQTEVYRRYKTGRADYYQNLVARKPKLKKFLNGWMNRVNSFPEV